MSEGVDGVEQRAVRAGHEAEGDDWDEGMAGNENMPAQRGRGQRLDRRHQEEEALRRRAKGALSQVLNNNKARWSTTGLGTRCMRIRHYPSGRESEPDCARASDHEQTSVDLPLSLPQFPPLSHYLTPAGLVPISSSA